MAEYGCQVEWQPVTGGKSMLSSGALNTESFNVIGRLPGMTPREIVVGAHIDSSGPEIPGANDDGSGVATIIELARVLAREPHEATLVFVAFCGEEAGLVGSKSFVETYPLENVALMLQLDMVSNDSPLLLFVDTKKAQAPAWLVSASIDAYHSLGYRNIKYPVFFQSLNSALDGASSDHAPFLEKGIPAIGFVTDLSFPIHTPNDSMEYFEPAGLERSGRLILELVRKFDNGQPEAKSGHYMLVLIGERPLFVPVVGIKILIILSLAVALLAFVRLYVRRKSRLDWKEDLSRKKSWPKLFIMNLVIVVVMIGSLWIMQRVSGQRTPWYAHPRLYVLYAFLFFVLGIWLSLQLTRRWRLRRNAFFYFSRASIFLTILAVAAWVAAGPRLALFPALGLLFLSLACLARWSWLKGLLWILAPFWAFRMLILSEADEFIFRMSAIAFQAFKNFALTVVFWTVLTIFFVLWTMPFLLGFAAVYRSARGDLWAMKRFRRTISIIPIGILAIGGSLYLRTVPAYDRPWEQEVTVTQKRDAENRTAIEFSSFGYLKGIEVSIEGRQETLNENVAFRRIEMPLEINWLKENVAAQTEELGEETMVHLRLELNFERPPYDVSLVLKSDRSFAINNANCRYQHQKNRARIRWGHAPGQNLTPTLDIQLPRGAGLDAELTATFRDVPVQVVCRGKGIHFSHRAEIRRKVEIVNRTQSFS